MTQIKKDLKETTKPIKQLKYSEDFLILKRKNTQKICYNQRHLKIVNKRNSINS